MNTTQNRAARLLLLLALLLPSLPARADGALASTVTSALAPAPATHAWEPVGPGIDYQEFFLPTPNQIYVARMDRSNPSVILESSIGEGRLGSYETTSGMAQRYDQAINTWGPGAPGQTFGGTRNRVVIAINGYYFGNVGPQRGQFYSGWYAKRHDNLQNGSGFAWKNDRSLFIGGCVDHRPARQKVTFADGDEQLIAEVNRPRRDNVLMLYTPQWDATTLTDDASSEVLVEMSRPVGIAPPPDMVTGTVRAVYNHQGNTPIPFDHIVLSGHGTAGNRLMNHVQVGDVIGISQDIRHYEVDCNTPNPDSWAGTYTSTGAQYEFLKDGVIQGYPNDTGAIIRNPRTAIAFNNQYVFFIVVDGRDPRRSVGMSIVEVATFAKNTLGATDGIALDGGGSSTMVVNGVVMNIPSDGVTPPPSKTPESDPSGGRSNRPRGQDGGSAGRTPVAFIPGAALEAQAPSGSQLYLPLVDHANRSYSNPQPQPGPRVERPVQNGIMMVVVEPMLQSGAFAPGDPVRITGPANLRLGPGTNFYPLAGLAAGAQGVVIDHAAGLNGVFAKGAYWWKVSVDGLEGWVSEDLLEKSP